MRITADTNILVSALNYQGPPRRFLDLAENGDFTLTISDAILNLNETSRILRVKFNWPDSDIQEARDMFLSISEHITPKVILDVVKDDPDDNAILECAQTAHSDYIVTGDKHLLKLRQYDGMPIVTVSQFLSQFRAAGAPGRG